MHQENDKFKRIDPRILKSYLESNGSREQQMIIAQWFSELLSNEEVRRFTNERWDNIPENIPIRGYDPERIHGRIHHSIRLEEAAAVDRKRRKFNFVRFITRVAAVLFIPIVAFTLYNWRDITEGKQTGSMAEVQCPLGARTSFVLPDGSTGWLNGGSTLSFPTRFEGKFRSVKLCGEAYFDVLENPKRPFIVDTDDMKIKVYGTSFNVMTYTDDLTSEVILETGEIEVFRKDGTGSEKSMGIMTPGIRGVLSRETGMFKKDIVDIDKYTAWKEGKLVLRNESMTEIVKKINRWYNVNIIIGDSRLKDFNYRATFVDETLDEVLNMFQHTSPIVFRELGREKNPDGSYGKRTIEMQYHRSN